MQYKLIVNIPCVTKCVTSITVFDPRSRDIGYGYKV